MMCMDSCGGRSVMALADLRERGLRLYEGKSTKFETVSGTISDIGLTVAWILYPGHDTGYLAVFRVLVGEFPTLLGRDFQRKYGVDIFSNGDVQVYGVTVDSIVR